MIKHEALKVKAQSHRLCIIRSMANFCGSIDVATSKPIATDPLVNGARGSLHFAQTVKQDEFISLIVFA